MKSILMLSHSIKCKSNELDLESRMNHCVENTHTLITLISCNFGTLSRNHAMRRCRNAECANKVFA